MKRLFWALLVSALLMGCEATHLAQASYTKIGLEVSSTGTQPTSAVFGYKRFEGAFIPVDPGSEDDIMSVLSYSEVENGWTNGLEVYHIFGTGAAATLAVQQSQVLARLLERNGDDEEDEDAEGEDEEGEE